MSIFLKCLVFVQERAGRATYRWCRLPNLRNSWSLPPKDRQPWTQRRSFDRPAQATPSLVGQATFRWHRLPDRPERSFRDFWKDRPPPAGVRSVGDLHPLYFKAGEVTCRSGRSGRRLGELPTSSSAAVCGLQDVGPSVARFT